MDNNENNEPVAVATETVSVATETVSVAAEPVSVAAEPVSVATETVSVATEPVATVATEPVETLAVESEPVPTTIVTKPVSELLPVLVPAPEKNTNKLKMVLVKEPESEIVPVEEPKKNMTDVEEEETRSTGTYIESQPVREDYDRGPRRAYSDDNHRNRDNSFWNDNSYYPNRYQQRFNDKYYNNNNSSSRGKRRCGNCEDEEIYDKGWTRDNKRVVKYYVNFLSYMCLVYHFYYFKLKQIEGYWSWAIIVLASFSAALSLFQYNDDNEYVELAVKITLTVFTLVITLISSWIKKQNYVERISELGKYSIKINKLKNNVKAVLEDPISNRISYDKFTDDYKSEIVEFISNRPLISPYDWKETVFIISKYYPELAAYEFPWNKIDNYGSHAIDTYTKLKYSTFWKKLKHCYFCKSKCICRESTEGKELAKKILEEDIKFYQNLPKYDLDYNPYHFDDMKPDNKFVYSDSDSEYEDNIDRDRTNYNIRSYTSHL